MTERASIGIDVGGTKTLCILVNEKLETLAKVKFKTEPTLGQKRFSAELIAAIKILKRVAKRKGLALAGAGIGFAGQVDKIKCHVRKAPNIRSLEDYPIGKMIADETGLECVIGNDVHLGLYAEHQVGAAKGCSHVLGVFFGTGVGGAAIVNGQLYEGATGFGGQVGCILAQPVGGPKAALSHGIVDRIASKASIASEALQMAVKNWAPYLHQRVGTDLAKVGWRILAKAIASGDRQVEDMLRARLQVVGIALSNVVNFMNPDMVVLGGGLTDEMPKLVLEELGEGLRTHLVPEVAAALKIKAAKLGGGAVAIGGAKLALVELD
ncbi:MAG TPA: ROK family protein [bacterium]|nr:ROK family protein [bacterium]